MDNVKERMDIFFDKSAPSIVVDIEEYRNGYSNIRKRGGRIRAFTEVTKENLSYCKELKELVDELRHLDGVRGGIAVSESEYMASTVLQESTPLTEVIYSNVREVVEQGQYIFDTLWSTAIPAEQKIKELEEGHEHPVIQVIPDTHYSIARAFDLMNSAKHEIMVMFATAKTFLLAVEARALDYYEMALQRGVNVTILVPLDNDSGDLDIISRDNRIYDTNSLEQSAFNVQLNKARNRIPKADLIIVDKSMNTKITILVVDNQESMVWELKDDTLLDPYQAGGIATYSNIPSIAFSYSSIIHIIRKQADLYRELKESEDRLEMLNKQLESRNIIQQEFINIAAHELRTPIQPILGLSEIALARYEKNYDIGDAELKEILDVITRNAKRLHRLTEDILDVTRIDSEILKLNKEAIDIDKIIEDVVNDFRNEVDKDDIREFNILTNINGASRRTEHENLLYDTSQLVGDKNRIVQILSNLLSNAVKFSSKGGNITISKEINFDNNSVVISVEDRGSGIDPEIFPRLFSKFSTKSDHGTGLGLYICKNLVEVHGGRIWAQNNKDGPGATFSFSLPMTTVKSEVEMSF